MLWLLNNKNSSNENITQTNIEFCQFFIDSELVYNDGLNEIYSRTNVNANTNTNTNANANTNTNMHEKIEKIIENKNIIEYDIQIKILNELIEFVNSKNGEINVFSFKMNVNKHLSKLFFNFVYSIQNLRMMPNLIESQYDLFENYHLKVYEIEKNIQFVIETNKKNNIITKYWIGSNYEILCDFLTKNKISY